MHNRIDRQSGPGRAGVEQISPERSELPIRRMSPEIESAIIEHDVVVIASETGSGKSTEVPLIVFDALKSHGFEEPKIAITEPRRVAAMSVAERVANNTKTNIGDKVGWQIMAERNATPNTDMVFMTEGILLGTISQDPLLKKWDAVILDEAHERSANMDFLIGLIPVVNKKRVEGGLRPLKLVIMSATIDAHKFGDFFGEHKTIQSEGRQFDITDIEPGSIDLNINDHKIDGYLMNLGAYVLESIRATKDGRIDNGGDILVFLPGEAEIERVYRELEIFAKEHGCDLLKIFGAMPLDEQRKIFQTHTRQRIILATNIAETSITVPGITMVVDSGLVRQSQYHPDKKAKTLDTVPHSNAGRKQRRGRAGRVQEGMYIDLLPQKIQEEALDFTQPEITRSSVTDVVLRLKAMGINNIAEFRLLDPIDVRLISDATEELSRLGALDTDGNITSLGKEIEKVPTDAASAKMLIEAKKTGFGMSMAMILAMLRVGNVFFPKPNLIGMAKGVALSKSQRQQALQNARRPYLIPGSDLKTLLGVFNAWTTGKLKSGDTISRGDMIDGGINPKALNEAKKIFDMLKRSQKLDSDKIEAQEIDDALGLIVLEQAQHVLRCSSDNRRRIDSLVSSGDSHQIIFPSTRDDWKLAGDQDSVVYVAQSMKAAKDVKGQTIYFAENLHGINLRSVFARYPESFMPIESISDYSNPPPILFDGDKVRLTALFGMIANASISLEATVDNPNKKEYIPFIARALAKYYGDPPLPPVISAAIANIKQVYQTLEENDRLEEYCVRTKIPKITSSYTREKEFIFWHLCSVMEDDSSAPLEAIMFVGEFDPGSYVDICLSDSERTMTDVKKQAIEAKAAQEQKIIDDRNDATESLTAMSQELEGCGIALMPIQPNDTFCTLETFPSLIGKYSVKIELNDKTVGHVKLFMRRVKNDLAEAIKRNDTFQLLFKRMFALGFRNIVRSDSEGYHIDSTDSSDFEPFYARTQGGIYQLEDTIKRLEDRAKKERGAELDIKARELGLPQYMIFNTTELRDKKGTGLRVWVIADDGSSRDCDTSTKTTNKSRDSRKTWNQIRPGELVIQYSKSNPSNIEFNVIHKPDNVTEEQRDAVQAIQEYLSYEYGVCGQWNLGDNTPVDTVLDTDGDDTNSPSDDANNAWEDPAAKQAAMDALISRFGPRHK
jgi:HrpA-like RNA helicase